MPVRLILTKGTTADSTQAIPLIEGIGAEHLLADKGYDSNEIVEAALAKGMNPVIPPRSNRKEPRAYDLDLTTSGGERYEAMARCGNTLCKKVSSICQIRALVLWTKLF